MIHSHTHPLPIDPLLRGAAEREAEAGFTICNAPASSPIATNFFSSKTSTRILAFLSYSATLRELEKEAGGVVRGVGVSAALQTSLSRI